VSNGAVAARYAEGLFKAAQAEGTVEALRAEVDGLAQLVAQTPALRSLIERPDLEADRKLETLRATLGRHLTQTVMNLLGSLVRHGRGHHLAATAEAFGHLADEAAGVVRGEVRTAVGLTGEQRSRLVAALEQLTGRRVLLEERLDGTVLCGVRVRVGDRLIDGSGAGRLARLRESLVQVRGQSG